MLMAMNPMHISLASLSLGSWSWLPISRIVGNIKVPKLFQLLLLAFLRLCMLMCLSFSHIHVWFRDTAVMCCMHLSQCRVNVQGAALM